MNKVAILISGEPRYCRDFDSFIANIKAESVDWFIHHWDQNNTVDKGQVVNHTWENLTEEKIYHQFVSHIPDHHKVRSVILKNLSEVKTIDQIKGHVHYCSVSRASQMWTGWKQVDQTRIDYETANNFKYDLVIRARNDLELVNELDTERWIEDLRKNPRKVISENSDIMRVNGYNWNDYISIGSSESITILHDIIYEMDTIEWGVFNQVTAIAQYLHLKEISTELHELGIRLRRNWKLNQVDFGTW